MDFPKSVPGVGLVNGRFVDEDPLAATPGSLIPSGWGNLVTEELLNVLEAAGIEPSEDDANQLNEAIDKKINAALPAVPEFATQVEAEAGVSADKVMSPVRVFQAIAKVVTQATEGAFGWLKIATQTQVNTGDDDKTAVSPKKLATAVRTQALSAFTTTGATPALTLTPIPAITSYVAGQRFRVKFSAASSATNSLNISGLGAKNIHQYDSVGVKVAAIFAVGQLGDVEYDGVSMILLDSLPPALSPVATESTAGIAAIATQAQTSAGTDDSAFVSPLKLEVARPKKSQCTAWVNFDGTGTVTVRDSYNVSSVTDLSVGSWQVNFSTAMSNSNFASAVGGGYEAPTAGQAATMGSSNQTTSSVRVSSRNNTPAGLDVPNVSLVTFGGRS